MSELILEKNYELPKNWIQCEISTICSIYSGIGFPKIHQGKSKGTYPFYKVGDISRTVQNEKIMLDISDNYVSQKICDLLKGKIFPKGTIVFAKIGEALKLNRRAICSINSLFDNNVMGLFPDESIIEILYLYYFFITIKLGNLSRSTTVPSIRKTDIDLIIIPLPPLLEQKRIVQKIESIFSRVDAIKEKLKIVKNLLKKSKQSVLKSAFEGKLTERWRNNNIIGLENSDNEKLLNGWIECKLENITQKVLKINPKEYPNQKFQYCDIDSIDNNKLKITSPKKFLGKDAPSRARQLIHVNDILFSTVRTYLHNVGIVPIELDNQLASTGFCVLRNNNLIVNRLIFYLVQTVQFEHYLNPLQRGTSYPAVRNNDVINYVFQLPSIPEQKRIVQKIESIFGRVDAIEKQVDDSLIKLDQLKKSTLKKAFEGKLVPQNPNDEPASILLERIKQEKSHKQKK